MKNCLIKISGDLLHRKDVLDWIAAKQTEFNLTICCGGGVQINLAFKRWGFRVKYGPLGRETESPEQLHLATKVLEENRHSADSLLRTSGITATTIIPVIKVGNVDCPINGDQLVLASYIGFDSLFVLTLQSRVALKQGKFGGYPKISIFGFPD